MSTGAEELWQFGLARARRLCVPGSEAAPAARNGTSPPSIRLPAGRRPAVSQKGGIEPIAAASGLQDHEVVRRRAW